MKGKDETSHQYILTQTSIDRLIQDFFVGVHNFLFILLCVGWLLCWLWGFLWLKGILRAGNLFYFKVIESQGQEGVLNLIGSKLQNQTIQTILNIRLFLVNTFKTKLFIKEMQTL